MDPQAPPAWFFPLLIAIAVGAIGFGLALVATGAWVGAVGEAAGVLVLLQAERLRHRSEPQPVRD